MTRETVLLLARHGETDANVAGVWQGATDHPLNEHGKAQARALGRYLAQTRPHIAAIYTSPLRRARQTANIVAEFLGDVPVVEEQDLSEYNLGEWEGLTYQQLRYEKRLWERMDEDPYWAPPGGESAYTFATRVLRGLTRIGAAHPGQEVLVVGHGGALATALAMLLEGDGRRWRDYQMANCALAELILADPPRLVRLNETAHLEEVGHSGQPHVG